jgi:hypothetical protein
MLRVTELSAYEGDGRQIPHRRRRDFTNDFTNKVGLLEDVRPDHPGASNTQRRNPHGLPDRRASRVSCSAEAEICRERAIILSY